MKRETGYYWVKRTINGKWIAAHFTDEYVFGNKWTIPGNGLNSFLDEEFAKIKETRILNPDETRK